MTQYGAIQEYISEVTDQGFDTLHQLSEQHSHITIAEEFQQCIKVRLPNEMLVRGVDFQEKCIQLLQ